MANPFGVADARETAIAHQLVDDPEFNEDPVDLYQKLLTEHGSDSTGRIWSLACTLWDRKHNADS